MASQLMLPYMATPAKLLDAHKKGLVAWRPPSDPNMSVRREIWMPVDLRTQINGDGWAQVGKESTKAAASRRRDCITLMTAFIRGDDMEVGIGDDCVDFKAMTPSPGQMWQGWELRPVVERPKTRLFGVLASRQDFLVWSCVPKNGLDAAAQTNLARTAVTRSSAVLGNTILGWKNAPRASDLGGIEYGWWQ